MVALFANFLTIENIWIHELDEIGALCSKFWQEKFANFADAMEKYVARNMFV